MTNFFDYRNSTIGRTYAIGREREGWSGVEYATKEETELYIEQMIDNDDAEDGDYEIGYFSTNENGDDYLINSETVNFEDDYTPWSLSDFDGSYTSMMA